MQILLNHSHSDLMKPKNKDTSVPKESLEDKQADNFDYIIEKLHPVCPDEPDSTPEEKISPEIKEQVETMIPETSMSTPIYTPYNHENPSEYDKECITSLF